MLATVPQDIPLREQSHLDLQSHEPNRESAALDDRLCPGCKQSAVNEQGGLVVAFGQSFFHVDCFKCAKCRNQVTADTNLLLLSDGSPICANCSYSCNICHQPILDEAIMTGDDSYHAHCFKCKVCHNRIDELVFAKTSQGIYCMNCHNERMIKIRKHAQKKAERERANGGSSSSKSREQEARNFHRDIEKSEPPIGRPYGTPSRNGNTNPLDSTIASPQKLSHTPHVNDAIEPPASTLPRTIPTSPSPSNPSFPLPPVSVVPLDQAQSAPYKFNPSHAPNSLKSNTLPVPLIINDPDTKRSNTYDDDNRNSSSPSRQHDGLHPNGFHSSTTEGLSLTSRRDKRRSINPGISLFPFKDQHAAPSPNASPRHNTSIDAYAYGASHSSDDSHSANSRHLPANGPTLSSYSSPTSLDDSNEDNTIVIASPPCMTIDLDHTSQHSPLLPSRMRSPSNPSSRKRTSTTLSPVDPHSFRSQQRQSSTSVLSLEGHRSGTSSRSASPAYRADVPHSVESGTDTEPENDAENDYLATKETTPPAPPPKDKRDSQRTSVTMTVSDMEPDVSELSQLGDISDDMTESPPVESTSHTTFIAPALPPIRFSMNTADFSDLMNTVVTGPALHSLDNYPKTLTDGSNWAPASSPFNAGDSTAPSIVGDTHSQLTITPSEYTMFASDHSDPTNGVGNDLRSLQESAASMLRTALNVAKTRGAASFKVDTHLIEALLETLDSRSIDYQNLKNKVDNINRASKQYIDGLTVAQAEYDRELKARRDAEAEVTRLRVLLSGQAVRLTALSGDTRRQELRQQMTKEITENLSGLEHDLSRLKVERDMTVAEMEELSATKSSPSANAEIVPSNLGRSLTKRLDNIRVQYQRELIPLTEQKEALSREIAELKAVRDVFLEETTVLNARNEELAQLSAVYARRLENADVPMKPHPQDNSRISSENSRSQTHTNSMAPSLSYSTSASSTVYDDSQDLRSNRVPSRSDTGDMHTPAKVKFKWPGTKSKEVLSPSQHIEIAKGKAHIEHNFQQLSVLRFTRCDHCNDKMWGSQLRCTVCQTSIHVRCIANLQIACTQQHNIGRDLMQPTPMLPSMFGRELTEQARAESRDEERFVPIIVEKCIEAVEARALDYEGIYRKTGGSSQTKAITQLFERGDSASFDLCDIDRFNDICSVTSVLKTYFRSLPIPLLTFDLHDQFIAATNIRDPALRQLTLVDLINKLPQEHYYTLRLLMLHLNHVRERSDKNLMNGRNLGVVFGPTLMRSRDPGAEFSDMAGKALFIEWLVDNAPQVFGII